MYERNMDTHWGNSNMGNMDQWGHMNWSEFLKAEMVRTGTYGMKFVRNFPRGEKHLRKMTFDSVRSFPRGEKQQRKMTSIFVRSLPLGNSKQKWIRIFRGVFEKPGNHSRIYVREKVEEKR